MQPTITAEYLKSQGLSENFPQRFWPKVNKDGPIPPHCPELGQCWVWTAHLTKSKLSGGYGRIGGGGFLHHITTHRGSWVLHFGPIPEGLHVLHKCDNRKCVNPSHLFLGTYRDNYYDSLKKGRRVYAKGDKQPAAKLSYEKADVIRELYKTGSTTILTLANQFGVSETAIHQVIHNRGWVRELPKL